MKHQKHRRLATNRRAFLSGAALTICATIRERAGLGQADAARQVIRTPVPPHRYSEPQATPRDQEEVLDARAFGARGDGMTDDTAALQRAMEAAAAQGRPLNMAPGFYLVSRPLYAPSNLTTSAAGATLVTMIPELGDPGQIVAPLMIEGVSNVRITGLAVDGRQDLFPHTEFKAGICIHAASDVEIRDCELFDCKGDGLICFSQFPEEGNRNVTVMNTTMRNNYRLGCAITDLVGGSFIGCHFVGNAGTAPMSGVDIEPHDPGARIDDIRFEQCDFSGNGSTELNTGAGVLVALVPERTSPQGNIRFVDCVMEDNATMGALLLEAEGIVFERCVIRGNGDAGLGVLSTTTSVTMSGGAITQNAFYGVRVEMLDGELLANFTLTGVEITDNSQERLAEYDGVNLSGWCRDVVIAQCRIGGQHRYGVWVDQAVESLTLAGNDLSGNVVGPIFPENLLAMNQA